MARRITPAQLRSRLRQAEQKQRQAINRYNAAVRRYNRELKRAVDRYNRDVAAHNARVRANRQRLKREIARLNSAKATTRYVTYQRSVVALRQSFSRIAASAEKGTWRGGTDLLDLTEGETANSVAVLNALIGDGATRDGSAIDVSLQSTEIGHELAEISPELDARWRGALFALNPSNPDAARHFCTSAREILSTILNVTAPDDEVLASNPGAERTPEGRVTRRARIRYCLDRRGASDPDLEAFVEEDLENVITLFRDFNDGTHGSAGRFDLAQLAAIKRRVEDAIVFLHRIVR